MEELVTGLISDDALTSEMYVQAVEDILALNKIARNLHRRRFEDGALRLDKVKLGFGLDEEGNPGSCHIQGVLFAKKRSFKRIPVPIRGTRPSIQKICLVKLQCAAHLMTLRTG